MNRWAWVSIWMVLLPTALGAQAGAVGMLSTGYDFADPQHAGVSTVTLLWAPFQVRIPFLGRGSVDVAGGFASGRISGPTGEDATLSGWADTRVLLGLGLAGGRVRFRGGVSVPGNPGRTVESARVMGILGSDLLAFPAAPWVGAGGVTGSVETTMGGDASRLTLQAGYNVWRDHDILEDGGVRYRPGDEVRFRAVGEVALGGTRGLSVVLGAHRYAADAADGANLFQSGVRVEGMVSLAFPIGLSGSAQGYGGLVHRRNGVGFRADDWFPGINNAPSRTLFLGGVEGRMPWGRGSLLPDVGFRLLRSGMGPCFRSDLGGQYETLCPGGQGWMVGAGAAVEVPLRGPRGATPFLLVPRGRVRYGRVVHWGGGRWVAAADVQRGGPSSGFVGWEAGLVLRAEVGR